MGGTNGTVVGALAQPHGVAMFERGEVVVDAPDDGFACYRRGALDGPPLPRRDWSAFIAAGQAIALPPTDFVPDIALWVLRARCEREMLELRGTDAVLFETLLPNAAVGCLVEEPKLLGVRERWVARALEEALELGKEGLWECMRVAAAKAFALDAALSPGPVAALALSHELLGASARAAGYVEMVRRSRGDVAAALVVVQRDAYRAQVVGALRQARRW